jgi:hypothetical protein
MLLNRDPNLAYALLAELIVKPVDYQSALL